MVVVTFNLGCKKLEHLDLITILAGHLFLNPADSFLERDDCIDRILDQLFMRRIELDILEVAKGIEIWKAL